MASLIRNCDGEGEKLPWQKYINFLLWFHYGTEIENDKGSWVEGGPGLTSNVASKTRNLYGYTHKKVMFAAIYSVIKKDEEEFLEQKNFKSIRDLIIINIWKLVKNSNTKTILEKERIIKEYKKSRENDLPASVSLNILESEMYCSKQWKILRRFLMDMLDHIAGPTQCSSTSTRYHLDHPAIPTLEDMTNMDDIEEGHYYVCEQSWSAVGMTEPEIGDPDGFKYCHYSGSFNANKIREHELRCSYVREADQKKIKELEKYMNITDWDKPHRERDGRPRKGDDGKINLDGNNRNTSEVSKTDRASMVRDILNAPINRGFTYKYSKPLIQLKLNDGDYENLAKAWKEWKRNLPNGGELLKDDENGTKIQKKKLLEKLQIFFHENSTPIKYREPPIDVFNRFMKRQTLLDYDQEKTEGKEDCFTKMKNLFWEPKKNYKLSEDYVPKKNHFESWHHSPKGRKKLARKKAGYEGGSKKRTRRRNKYRKKSNRKFNKKYSKKRKRKKSKKRRRKRTKRRRKRKNIK